MAAAESGDTLADGGPCVAGPDGEWVAPSAPSVKTLLLALDLERVIEERQKFGPSGHYPGADVMRLDQESAENRLAFSDSRQAD
jgi:hypothetical protein